MTPLSRFFTQFTLSLLIATVTFGFLSSLAYVYPELFNKLLPFYQLRPFHVSAALFWIIGGASAVILYYKSEVFPDIKSNKSTDHIFMLLWMGSILVVFVCYAFKKFGGREYWEFPPVLNLAFLVSWLVLMIAFFTQWFKSKIKKPLYVWMWATGIFFFLITFLEQNLWLIPWFRSSYLKDVTVQWKANGAMVGAWNQMIYGSALYLMVKICGDKNIAETKKSYFFYFLGLTNLMFNWGHHIYNVPNPSWVRNVSYIISMTELAFFVNIIMDFKSKLDEQKRLKHLIPYRFLIAAEFWVFANLILVLFMSVPAVNRYTHGTHLTVAHAMVATIGINSMILLGCIGYILNIDAQTEKIKTFIGRAYWLSQLSLGVFWLCLVVAGVLKGYRMVALDMKNFQEMMTPVTSVIQVSSYAGLFLAFGIGSIAVSYIRILQKSERQDENLK